MKKIILILSLLVIIAPTVFGQNVQRTNTALNTSTWTAITVDTSNIGNSGCINAAWIISDDTSYLIADDSSGTNSTTYPANTRLQWECINHTGGVVFYAKATAGTPTLTFMYQAKR